MIIRQEELIDYKAVYDLNRVAFGQNDESKLIEKIRQGNNFVAELSLVAEVGRQIVGHILFSKIKIKNANATDFESLALAPMAVLPKFQKKGIGKNLVREGLKKAKELGFESVIVLGHKDYYSKLGFEKASKWRIVCPFEVPDESFMAIELVARALSGKSGTAVYPQQFDI